MNQRVQNKYNALLANSLRNFLETWYKKLKSNDYEAKLKFLTELKSILANSAVITRADPKYVPLKRLFVEIYDLLYESSFFRKSYVDILKSSNLGKIEKAESKIISKIEHELAHIDLGDYSLPHDIKSKVKRRFRRHIKKIARTLEFKGTFGRRLVYSLMLFMILNILSTAVVFAAEKPFASKKVRLAEIEHVLDEAADIVNSVSHFEMYKDSGAKLMLHSKLFARGNYEEFTANEKIITDWLKENQIFDQSAWLDSLDSQSPEIIAKKLQKHIQERVGNSYHVKHYLGSEIFADGITEIKNIPEYNKMIVSIMLSAKQRLMQLKERDEKTGKGEKIIRTEYSEIETGITKEGNLVFRISIIENIEKDYGDFSRIKKVRQVIRIVIMPDQSWASAA